jgi:tetratricopeptide (TPR) repeat protein
MIEVSVRRRIIATVLVLAATGASGTAFAAGPDAEQRSRTLFKQAETLANAGSWAEACPLFQAAHDLHGTGGTALRAADCYEKIAKYDRALELYQYIVDHRDGDKNPERATLAERRVEALKKQLGPAAPPPTAAPAPPPSAPLVPQEPVREPNRVPAYALFGVAGAGLIVGAISGGLALKQAGDVKSICMPNVPCPREAGDKSAAETKAWVSNVGFGFAIAGAVVGAVLYATGNPKKDAAQTAFGPDGLTLRF